MPASKPKDLSRSPRPAKATWSESHYLGIVNKKVPTHWLHERGRGETLGDSPSKGYRPSDCNKMVDIKFSAHGLGSRINSHGGHIVKRLESQIYFVKVFGSK